MSFLKQTTNANGSKSEVHRVHRVEIMDGTATAYVHSFATIEALEAPTIGAPNTNWQGSHPIPLQQALQAQDWLISPEGPFAGGTALPDVTPLAKAQAIKWTEIKERRDELESGGFPYMGVILDSDPRSFQRITGAAIAAREALAQGVPFAITWTTQDNGTLELPDAEAVIGMPCALAAYANTLHETTRALREQIEAAQTVEEVQAIAWPVPAPPAPPEEVPIEPTVPPEEPPPAEEGEVPA